MPTEESAPAYNNEFFERLTAPQLETLYSRFYQELQKYVVVLPSQITVDTLQVFVEKISQAREYANRVNSILMYANCIRHIQGKRLRQAELLLRQRKDQVTKEQREILRTYRSTSERDSHINSFLETELAQVADQENSFEEAKFFYDVVRHTYDNLNSTRSDLLSQLSSSKQMIFMGQLNLTPEAAARARQASASASDFSQTTGGPVDI